MSFELASPLGKRGSSELIEELKNSAFFKRRQALFPVAKTSDFSVPPREDTLTSSSSSSTFFSNPSIVSRAAHAAARPPLAGGSARLQQSAPDGAMSSANESSMSSDPILSGAVSSIVSGSSGSSSSTTRSRRSRRSRGISSYGDLDVGLLLALAQDMKRETRRTRGRGYCCRCGGRVINQIY